jgi:hypothetical protein
VRIYLQFEILKAMDEREKGGGNYYKLKEVFGTVVL